MKLYVSPASPYVRKVRVVAREAGLAARIEEVVASVSPVAPNEQVSRDNPLGKLPVLIADDGSAIYDSPVICEYLDSLHSGRKLFPAVGPARWAALKLQALADGLLDAALLARYETALRPEPLRWPEWIAGQRHKIADTLNTLERDVDLLAGELTIGNISVACALGYLDLRFADDAWRTGRPKLDAWLVEVSKRESLRATIPKG
jgi:glutathione S-transferase